MSDWNGLLFDRLERAGEPVAGMQRVKVGSPEFRWLSGALKLSESFNRLTAEDLENIRPAVSLWLYPSERIVIRQGTSGNGLCVLYAGRVVVSRRLPGRSFPTPVKSLLPGDFFGEIAVIEDTSRTATVTTTDPSAIFMIQPQQFKAILAKFPELASHVRWTAGERLQELEWMEMQ